MRIIIFFLLGILISQAQENYFQISFGTDSSEFVADAVITDQKEIFITGHTNAFGAGGYDIFLTKTDSNGEAIFTKTYGGSSFERPSSIIVTEDDNLMLAGETLSFVINPADTVGGSFSLDLWLMKLDFNGSVIWSKTYSSDSTFTYNQDRYPQIIQTNDGGYLISGDTRGYNSFTHSPYIYKLSSDGDIEWSKWIQTTSWTTPTDIIKLNDGSCLISGISLEDNNNIFMMRVDIATSNVIWTKNLSTSFDTYDSPESTIVLDDSTFLICGLTHDTATLKNKAFLYKMNVNGVYLSGNTYEQDKRCFGFDIALDNDNSLNLLTNSLVTDSIENSSTSIIKLDTDGNIIDQKNIGIKNLNDDGYIFLRERSISNKLFIAGQTYTDDFKSDVHLLKIPENFEFDCSDSISFTKSKITNPLINNYGIVHNVKTKDSVANPEIFEITTVVESKKYCYEPIANFIANDTVLCPNTCISFFDSSKNSPANWLWEFEGGTPSSSNEQNPSSICYDRPGIYKVKLKVISAYGQDSLKKEQYVKVIESSDILCSSGYFIPNVFSPIDGKQFKPIINLNLVEYLISIYDRKGKLIYQTDDPNKYWDGKYKGRLLNRGTYVYKITGLIEQLNKSEELFIKGNVTLLY